MAHEFTIAKALAIAQQVAEARNPATDLADCIISMFDILRLSTDAVSLFASPVGERLGDDPQTKTVARFAHLVTHVEELMKIPKAVVHSAGENSTNTASNLANAVSLASASATDRIAAAEQDCRTAYDNLT